MAFQWFALSRSTSHVAALLNDLTHGISSAVIALRFHRGLAQGLVEIVRHLQTIRKDCSSVKQVVLSGGVFQNELLAQMSEAKFKKQDLSILDLQKFLVTMAVSA